MKTFFISRIPALIHSCITFIFTLIVCFSNAQEITINESFSSDTVFKPFTSSESIYGLHIRGGCTLISDSSLVRVVLIDEHGNHLLLFEAYPLIDTSKIFSFDNVCEETCYLNGIVPDL